MEEVEAEKAYKGHITYSCRPEVCVFQKWHVQEKNWFAGLKSFF